MRTGKTLCIIPARGGSKGIPRKNIRPFAGKPLIAHSIAQALRLKRRRLVDRVVVSTDDPAIARVSRRSGAEVPFLRPKRYAGDTSPVIDTIEHLLKELERRETYRPDYILLLQTTSPLRTDADIIAHFTAMDPRRFDAVITVAPTHHLLFHLGPKGELIRANRGVKLHSDSARQLFRPGYKLNGCFTYLVKREALVRERTVFPRRTRAVVAPAWRSVDLDHPEDFAVAELLFRNRGKLDREIRKMEREKSKR